MTGFFASTASRLQNRKAGALMTDPFAERQARVRAVTEANFGKVISPTRAPVKPAAVEAGGGAGIGDKRRLGRLVRQLLKGRAENICSG